MEVIRAGEFLSECFDAVIMLTWSNWKTEPRSNRFHYASRFSKSLPVLFVQPWGDIGQPLTVERTELDAVDIIQVSSCLDDLGVREFLDLLSARGIRRPLLWVYDTLHYGLLLEALHGSLRVYHATEDYFTDSKGWSASLNTIQQSIVQSLSHIDLLVGVSAGVINSYKTKGNYQGPVILAENGCDSEFFREIAAQYSFNNSQSSRPSAIFQGGINGRLDYELLIELCRRMPDWDFWFCGAADESNAGWIELQCFNNVHYFGKLQPKTFGKLMCRATVGIIPYIQDQWIRNSLPLKAYEYVACGLPVVTVPIDALSKNAELFQVAITAEQFDATLRSARTQRYDHELLSKRAKVAASCSYDERFTRVARKVVEVHGQLCAQPKRLNVVVLYDDRSTHVSAIQEHINAFEKYSSHKMHFMPVTGSWPLSESALTEAFDFSFYDVLILHYSVRISLPDYFSEGIAKAMERSACLKILFIQDEYDFTETARCWMERLKFDIVYTCVPEAQREKIYPQYRFPRTDFLPTLTGYVPEHRSLDAFVKPMAERVVQIAYRGRMLPYVYGMLGFEKYRIGVDVRRFSEERGVDVDIEVDDTRRIYGEDWYRFLGGARATLGTESGSNVFDFDGGIRRDIENIRLTNPDAGFDEIYDRVLAPHEGLVSMNQISPKIFESIRLRTALILFEGTYSGVVKPHEHFIPLKKDYSNIDEVFAKLEDFEYLTDMTERAYRDVIGSGKYSYRSFVEGVDRDINSRLLHGPRYQLFSVPAFARSAKGAMRCMLPSSTAGFTLLDTILDSGIQRESVFSALAASGNDGEVNLPLSAIESDAASLHVLPHAEIVAVVADESFPAVLTQAGPSLVARRSFNFRLLRVLWRVFPTGLRHKAIRGFRAALLRSRSPDHRRGAGFWIARRVWCLVPKAFRSRITRLITG